MTTCPSTMDSGGLWAHVRTEREVGVSERYRGEVVSHAVLQRRKHEVETRRASALARVDTLATQQSDLGQQLVAEVSELEKREVALQRHEQAESQAGLIASITRRLTVWRTAAPRRSFTEALLAQYKTVSTRLREASQFSDEVQLCALEMQEELDRLHRDLSDAEHNQHVARERIAELHSALAEVEEDPSLSDAERERRRDRHTYDLRTAMIALELHKTAAVQCGRHLEPARALRDTVLHLHEQMSTYVVQATHTVDSAGRSVHALGTMADAPAVVSELQQSIDELHAAMDATEHYIDQSQRFLAEVLPSLRDRIEKANAQDSAFIGETRDVIEGTARRLTDEAELRTAAQAEVERFLSGGEG